VGVRGDYESRLGRYFIRKSQNSIEQKRWVAEIVIVAGGILRAEPPSAYCNYCYKLFTLFFERL
jgi:hypothetical protein